MEPRFDRHFRMLRLCLWLIGCFSWISCATVRGHKPSSSFRSVELKIITHNRDSRWVSLLSDEGLMPEILNSTMDEANSQAEIITIRIHIRDANQLKIFQVEATSSGITVADTQME